MRRLTLLDSANSLEELGNLRGTRLHRLTGDRAGQHSISINDQWRICFVWKNGDAYDVAIVDSLIRTGLKTNTPGNCW
ncbi:type II toxin-antitoxin system RelE/ParE family toxin [Sphingomonas sp. PAMC 26617]|uniref:type II toxin-antitoxin system RelE/ParE family toxin n=1 Tax=Sphingomonas sp. PAMC 26617 TaxID=1112216 RepID=UPI0002886F6D